MSKINIFKKSLVNGSTIILCIQLMITSFFTTMQSLKSLYITFDVFYPPIIFWIFHISNTKLYVTMKAKEHETSIMACRLCTNLLTNSSLPTVLNMQQNLASTEETSVQIFLLLIFQIMSPSFRKKSYFEANIHIQITTPTVYLASVNYQLSHYKYHLQILTFKKLLVNVLSRVLLRKSNQKLYMCRTLRGQNTNQIGRR